MAHASTAIESALHNLVNDATSTVNIVQMLKGVNIDELKEFAHVQITKMDSNQQRSMYFTASPINDLLPDDVMQHILSYSKSDENINRRFVCKQWNGLCKLNQEILLRTVYQSFNEKYPEPLPPGKNTWIWDNGRKKLHPVEEGLGYKGLLRKGSDVETYCKDGDRILIHEEEYGNPSSFEFHDQSIPDNLHFIGLSPRGRSRIAVHHRGLCRRLQLDDLNVSIEEIVSDEEPSNVTMRNCTVQCTSDIVVGNNTSLYLDHCVVEHGVRNPRSEGFGDDSMITISPWANEVNICDCTITGSSRGIMIKASGNVHEGEDALVQIKITNTVFQQISEYAVVESFDVRYVDRTPRIKGTDLCILYGNTSSVESLEPNTLLHVEDIPHTPRMRGDFWQAVTAMELNEVNGHPDYNAFDNLLHRLRM